MKSLFKRLSPSGTGALVNFLVVYIGSFFNLSDGTKTRGSCAIYINSIHVSLVLFTNRQSNNARLLDAFIFTE